MAWTILVLMLTVVIAPISAQAYVYANEYCQWCDYVRRFRLNCVDIIDVLDRACTDGHSTSCAVSQYYWAKERYCQYNTAHNEILHYNHLGAIGHSSSACRSCGANYGCPYGGSHYTRTMG